MTKGGPKGSPFFLTGFRHLGRSSGMEIRGQKIVTLQDVMDHVIERIKDPTEARAFMAEYRKETPFADANVGTISLYYSEEYRAKIIDRFGVEDPEYWKNQTAGDSYNSGFLSGQLHMARLLSKEHGLSISYIEKPFLRKRTIINGEENVGPVPTSGT